MKVKVFDQRGQLVGPIDVDKVVKSNEDWGRKLTPEQYHITRGQGTERAFCGTLLHTKRPGVYSCVCCGLPLFASSGKFDSGSGWPSFFQPLAEENIVKVGRPAEILCARCDAHLGHVFEDGPEPTGLRFCINSVSLTFTDEADLASLADPAAEKTPGSSVDAG